MRDGTPQDIDITREKIVIKPLTTKEIDSDTLSVSITTFQFGLDTIFADMVKDTIVPNDYNNLIIDLRNNP